MEMTINPLMTETKQISLTDTIKKFGNKLFGFVRGKVKTNEDAEDILQEVWYQLSNLTNIDAIENTSAWLYSVSRNKITDFYRKKKTDNLEDYAYENEEVRLKVKKAWNIPSFYFVIPYFSFIYHKLFK